MSDLHIKGIFEVNSFLDTAEKIDEDFYNEVNKSIKSKTGNQKQEEVYKHVKIAEELMQQLEIRYYRDKFYVFSNGVYKSNLQLIEHTMVNINNNLKKSERAEVLDYIRIKQWRDKLDVDENFINMKNGMYDLKNNKLIPHNADIFTTCQINANYIENENIEINEDVEKFFDDITNNNPSRKLGLLQILGYCMSYKVDLQKCFIFYGPTASNGKSTLIEIINAMIGYENICHISVHQLLRRFTIAEITDKLLNTETEISTDTVTSTEIFKKIISGDIISAERKYIQEQQTFKPFAKFIFRYK